MRVIETDNFGRDYPDEKFVSDSLTLKEATELKNKLNESVAVYSSRYYMVVKNDYKLQPGFTP